MAKAEICFGVEATIHNPFGQPIKVQGDPGLAVTLEIINGINRIPVLKDGDFTPTS